MDYPMPARILVNNLRVMDHPGRPKTNRRREGVGESGRTGSMPCVMNAVSMR